MNDTYRLIAILRPEFMTTSHAGYLKRMAKLPFRRLEKMGHLFKRVYRLSLTAPDPEHRKHLLFMRDWYMMPYSLLPVDCFDQLAAYLCKVVEAGRPFNPGVLMVLKNMHPFPTRASQDRTIVHEIDVQLGDYDRFMRGPDKFAAAQRELLKNPNVHREWQEIREAFNADQYLDHKGLVRRRMILERGFRQEWQPDFDSEKDCFIVAFDGFCSRWNLYGVQNNQPLLQKPSFTRTPHSIIISVPLHTKIDFRRDINWAAVNELQDGVEATRRGPKASIGSEERDELARRAFAASLVADKKGWKGKKKHAHICKAVGWKVDREPRDVRRLVQKGRELFDQGNKPNKVSATVPAEDPMAKTLLARAQTAAAALSAKERRELMQWLAKKG